jgi:hypothetical protein
MRDDPRHAVRVQERGVQRQCAAHGVADEDDLIEGEVIEDLHQVRYMGEGGGRLCCGTGPEAPSVVRDDVDLLVGEGSRDRGPGSLVRDTGVQEHDGRPFCLPSGDG